MFNHEPDGYACPFCRVLGGVDSPLNAQQDIVCRTADAAALISPKWWPNNPGNVLVVPTAHYENLYDLPDRYGHAVHDVARQVAIAMREAYGCDGTSTRQHNEPGAYQDVWHYHLHVFPRYPGDDLYGSAPLADYATAAQRRPYADKLRGRLNAEPSR